MSQSPDTDRYEWFALRLTPHPNDVATMAYYWMRMKEFAQHLFIMYGTFWMIWGQEKENNHHFHLVFNVRLNPDTTDNVFRKQFRETLYTYWSPPEDKRGNAFYSLELVRDKDKALSYAVKDGRWDYWIHETQDA